LLNFQAIGPKVVATYVIHIVLHAALLKLYNTLNTLWSIMAKSLNAQAIIIIIIWILTFWSFEVFVITTAGAKR